MAERKSDGDHGAPQRTDSDLKDVVNGIKELTNEIRKLRETVESSAKTEKAKEAKNRLTRFGSNIAPKELK